MTANDRKLKIKALFEGSLWSILLGSIFVVVVQVIKAVGSESNLIDTLAAGGLVFAICLIVSTVSLAVAVPFIIAPAYLAYPRFISRLGATLLGVFCGPIFLALVYMILELRLLRADETVAMISPAAIMGRYWAVLQEGKRSMLRGGLIPMKGADVVLVPIVRANMVPEFSSRVIYRPFRARR